MPLEISTIDQIKNNRNLRWRHFNLDFDIWNLPKILKLNRFDSWTEIKFSETALNSLLHLNGKEGLYMFVAKPESPASIHHSYILYVGETNNIYKRFDQYLKYKNSTHPSDQKKRQMTIIWEDHLYFYYIETNYGNTKDREREEYDLIDSIVPPMNDKFRSEILKAHLKTITR